MKEILNEYYNININEYKEYNKGIIFFVYDNYYYLCKTKYDESYLKYIYDFVNKINIKLHSIIFNNKNEILSRGYVLLKLNNLIDKVSIEELNRFNIVVNEDNYIDIKKYWLNRIDYLFDNIDKNNYYNYDYYSGIIEMLMSYITSDYEGELYLVHKKLSLDTIEFYNPLNITVDLKLRDIASYILINNNYELLYKIITNLSHYERLYLFCRLVIPFTYFEVLESVLLDESSDEELIKYIDDYKNYEKHVKSIEKVFNYNIFKWIKKE